MTQPSYDKREGTVYNMSFLEDGVNRFIANHPSLGWNIVGVMLIRKPIPANQLRPTLMKIFTYDRMRSKIVINKRTGMHEYVDLGDCSKHFDKLMTTRTMKRGDDAELFEYIQSIYFKDFDASLPQWEVHVLRNYKFPNDTDTVGMALVWRLNHCLGDGVTLVQVLLSLSDDGNYENVVVGRIMKNDSGELVSSMEGAEVEYLLKKNENDPLLKLHQLLIRSWRSFRLWGFFVSVLYILPVALYGIITTELWDTRTCLQWVRNTHPPQTQKIQRVSKEFPVDKIKIVAKSMNATVNDVLMASLGGYLRRYLMKLNDPSIKNKSIRMRATIAVSLAPKRITDPIQFGNNVSFIPIDLPVDSPDFSSRVARMKGIINWLKSSNAAAIIYGIQWLLFHVAGPRLLQHKMSATSDRTTTALTNLQGPRAKVTLAGQKVERIFFWANPSSLSCNNCVFSYGGYISFGVIMDPNVITSPDLFMTCIEEEMDEIIARASTTNH